VGDRGVILAGPKKSGKTTLLMHLLSGGGADYVANDRVAVAWRDGVPVLRGMPTIITLREATASVPHQRQHVVKRGFHAWLTIDEARLRPPAWRRRAWWSVNRRSSAWPWASTAARRRRSRRSCSRA